MPGHLSWSTYSTKLIAIRAGTIVPSCSHFNSREFQGPGNGTEKPRGVCRLTENIGLLWGLTNITQAHTTFRTCVQLQKSLVVIMTIANFPPSGVQCVWF